MRRHIVGNISYILQLAIQQISTLLHKIFLLFIMIVSSSNLDRIFGTYEFISSLCWSWGRVVIFIVVGIDHDHSSGTIFIMAVPCIYKAVRFYLSCQVGISLIISRISAAGLPLRLRLVDCLWSLHLGQLIQRVL